MANNVNKMKMAELKNAAIKEEKIYAAMRRFF